MVQIFNFMNLLFFTMCFVCSASLFADLDDELEFMEPKPELLPSSPVEGPPPPTYEDIKPKAPVKKPKPSVSGKKSEKLPVHWSAKSLKGNKDKRIFELNQEVVVTQGDMRMTAETATFYLDESDQVETIIAKGDVKINKEGGEESERMASRSKEAHFFNNDQRVELLGDATLWRGTDVVRGKKIKHSLVTGWIEVDQVEGVMKSEETDNAK
jgi:lipopolysaccharide transport protein LptA